jgi:hypothetical protein
VKDVFQLAGREGVEMSKLKNLSRGGWIIVGVIVALVLVPSVAVAAVSYTGIEGTSGTRPM